MAVAANGVVGNNNSLPWSYPDELEHFRKTTDGQVMVMGRKTFDSTPANLFKQTPIVFSKDKSHLKSCAVVGSIQEFLAHITHQEARKIFMIGGAEIAKLFLEHNLISEFILTKIHKNYDGDARMDLNYFDQWHQRVITETDDYTTYNFKNPKGAENDIY